MSTRCAYIQWLRVNSQRVVYMLLNQAHICTDEAPGWTRTLLLIENVLQAVLSFTKGQQPGVSKRALAATGWINASLTLLLREHILFCFHKMSQKQFLFRKPFIQNFTLQANIDRGIPPDSAQHTAALNQHKPAMNVIMCRGHNVSDLNTRLALGIASVWHQVQAETSCNALLNWSRPFT